MKVYETSRGMQKRNDISKEFRKQGEELYQFVPIPKFKSVYFEKKLRGDFYVLLPAAVVKISRQRSDKQI